MTTDFTVMNFDKTKAKHAKRIDRLRQIMNERELEFEHFLDDDIWTEIANQTRDSLYFREHAGMKIRAKEIAQIINLKTRQAIDLKLTLLQIPVSYDTAFFILFYDETRAGMTQLLEDLQTERE